jgi:alanine dehydrogenase
MIVYVSDEDVKNNLPVKECVNELKEAFISYGKNESDSSARDRIYGKDFVFATMPAYYAKRGIAGLKTYMYGNNGYRFFVLIFDISNPEKVYAIDANVLGQIRTGALSAMVTSRIIKEKNINYTIIGSGFQAESQLTSILEYYELNHAYVYSRNFQHAVKFADKFDIDIKPVNDLSCLMDSDVISSATDTKDPIIRYKMLPGHYHINLIGANVIGSREADNEVMDNSDLVIEENPAQSRLESSEISDINDRGKIVTLGQFMLNPEKYVKGKTIFKCLGIGLEDLAAGYVVLKNMSLI